MAVLLRSTAADPRAAPFSRVRRDRSIADWRPKIIVVAFLTVSVTSLLARAFQLSLPAASFRPSSAGATASFSAGPPLKPISRWEDSSSVRYLNSSFAEASVSTGAGHLLWNVDVKDEKSSDNALDSTESEEFHSMQIKTSEVDQNISWPFKSKTPTDLQIKPSFREWEVSGSTSSELYAGEVRPGVNVWNMTNFNRSEIAEMVLPSENGRIMAASSGSEVHFLGLNFSDGERLVQASLNSKIPFKYLPPDVALIYAKNEIEHAPYIVDDPDLYAPLFQNLSVFKRSYELMERILKVYIYRDGSRPIFHTPELKGIYASEGWFMKLIERNRQFVVKDPNIAHLFYLPYSAHRLELALYVPGSHNMKPLSIFLRDYVNKISSKYPFWNRTRGSDHFLVACHDWGPYTTTLHAELCKNTIKALCNADASEGIFLRGKDVSLPETTIRSPRRPLRQIGGRPVSQRPILAFFAGYMHGRVRPILLEHWGNEKDEDMRLYGPLPSQVSRKMSYIEHMKSSKFCICPMGFEVNSPRIVEAIYYDCVPVIIADNFVLPFEGVLDWSAFSVVVEEKDIPKLKDILLDIPLRQYLKMQECVKRVKRHFLWHSRPEKYDIFHMILHSIWFSRLNQVQAHGDN